MRILHVVPTYLPATRYGGPIYSVHGLARAQAASGDEVQVFTTNVDGPNVSPVQVGEAVSLDGVSIWYFSISTPRRLYRSPGMVHALRERISSFDIVHIHSVFLWPTLAAARAAQASAVPYVVAPRGMLVADLIRSKSSIIKAAWIALFERKTIANAAAVHATSEREAEDLRALGLSMHRVVIVSNGVDLPEIIDQPSGSNGRYILFLGRINWKKGLDRLIAAMVHVPDVDLLIAGNDEDGLTPKLLKQARSLDLDGRVRFIGEVRGSEKRSLLQEAEAFVLPSHNENFGIAVLEAMVSAVPVVITPEVGLAKTVAEAGAGVVSSGDPEVFGRALASIIANPTKCRLMGKAGRTVAQKRFSWNAIASEMKTAYCEILDSQ